MFKELTLAAMLCAAAGSNPAAAQSTPATILEIDTENIVSYSSDLFDASKFATDPNLTTAAAARNFGFVMAVGDIIAVNGKPAKGTLVVRQQAVILSPTPNPGQAAADIVRTGVSDYLLEIQQADGTLVGNIHTLGLSGGTAAIASPIGSGGNLAVAGGTGAFVGARGQMATRLLPGGPGPRIASVTEDPSRRRNYGGGRVQFVVYLIPMTRPEIVTVASEPAVYHEDFSPVTATNPAQGGEMLIAMATGLGPTRPGVDLGQPFPLSPSNPLQPVNSPVDLTVNGRSAEVINSIGWPGMVNTYRVDFRLPDGTPAGMATVRLSAAWVDGSDAQIPVQ